jgi:hypothetical protein
MRILVTAAREHLPKKRDNEKGKREKSGLNEGANLDRRKKKKREGKVPYYGYRNS